MALNPDYMIAPSIQEYFVDKDTGLPLSAGKVFYYSDVNRSILKPIFTLTGTPGNYQYSEIPNPNTLTGVGTTSDVSGNDVLPYYYPFDANGDVELYYIVVQNTLGVQQFTRQGWPNFSEESSGSGSNIKNFIPNGQFLAHTDFPGNPNLIPAILPGQVVNNSTGIYFIAQGGFTFERSATSAAVDLVTFPSNTNSQTNPSQSPRYSLKVNCISPDAADAYKYIGIRFNDVNKFSNVDDTYTLFFNAVSNNLSSLSNVNLLLRHNYGTGGTPSPTDTNLINQTSGVNPITITPTNKDFTLSFAFPIPVGTSVGTNRNDFVEIIIALPPTQSLNVTFTDFALVSGTAGTVNLSQFPPETNAEMLAGGVAGWMPQPNPDGSDLFLPLQLTKDGMQFDHSEIGDIIADNQLQNYTSSLSTLSNRMLGDGAQYLTAGHSPLGIPYSRLQSIIFDNTTNIWMPRWGTGANFVSTFVAGAGTQYIFIGTNSDTSGGAIAPANGTLSPGFTFTPVRATPGISTGYQALRGYSNSYIQMFSLFNNGGSSVTIPIDTSSGILINTIKNIPNFAPQFILNTASMVVATLAGRYFSFYRADNPAQQYVVWFKVNGAGAQPAVGGAIFIEIDILSTYTINDLTLSIIFAMNSAYFYQVTAVAGSVIPANSWWSFGVKNSVNYYVWYSLNGSGTDPKPGGYLLGIPVSYTVADSIQTITQSTIKAINSTYFSAPQLQGVFLRGYDPNNDWDSQYRFDYNNQPNLSPPSSFLGSFQSDNVVLHQHGIPQLTGSNNTTGTLNSTGNFIPSGNTPVPRVAIDTGGAETGMVTTGQTLVTPSNIALVGTSGLVSVNSTNQLNVSITTGSSITAYENQVPGYENVPVNMSVNWVIKY